MPSSDRPVDVAVIGGGILGLATAMTLAGRHEGLHVAVLEKENVIARHQTGHNSGVIHSGLYYRPGSAKARLAVEGARRLYDFCAEQEIPVERCGKVVVATSAAELPRLERLQERGEANGVPALRSLGAAELQEIEPEARGLGALHVPSTGIVDFVQVSAAYQRLLEERGGEVRLGSAVGDLRVGAGGVRLSGSGTLHARYVVNCAGLHADRVSALAGARPPLRIVPFRGEYYELREDRRGLVRNLIYPVPDPAFPFLGVHLTRRIDGAVEAGPNAVLALHREGYRWHDVSLRDTFEAVSYPGLLRLARSYWRTGLGEVWRSASKAAFVRALRRLLPALEEDDLQRGGAGVRAQALHPSGALVDDFEIVESERMIHVLNAPSPAATASLGIGERIADLADQSWFGAAPETGTSRT